MIDWVGVDGYYVWVGKLAGEIGTSMMTELGMRKYLTTDFSDYTDQKIKIFGHEWALIYTNNFQNCFFFYWLRGSFNKIKNNSDEDINRTSGNNYGWVRVWDEYMIWILKIRN